MENYNDLKPIHKFNNGNGATLCNNCRKIIANFYTQDLFCQQCRNAIVEIKRPLTTGEVK